MFTNKTSDIVKANKAARYSNEVTSYESKDN
jgi:hypothetical protein